MEIHADLKNTMIMVTHDVDEAVLLSDRIVMMSNGPAATIGRILDIDLPRPRDRIELADNTSFNHMRSEVLKFLYEGHQQTGSGTQADSDEPPSEPHSTTTGTQTVDSETEESPVRLIVNKM